MKGVFVLFVLFLGGYSIAQKYNLDLPNAKVSFYFHGEKVNGSLAGLKANININKDKPEESSISGSVDVSTIQTGNKIRDKHLKSGDYFNVKKFPTMTFKATKVRKEGSGFSMTGKIQIKDIERDETFTLSISGGKLTFKGTINSADYGIMKKKDRDFSKVDITVEIPFL